MILITGANGQLGHDFQKLFDELKEEYIATDVNNLDITDIEKVREFVKKLGAEMCKKFEIQWTHGDEERSDW